MVRYDYRTQKERSKAEAERNRARGGPNMQPVEDKSRPSKRLRGNSPEEEPLPADDPMDDDAGTGTSLALAAPAARTFGGGRTGRTDGSETGVDPFIHYRINPFNETQNAIMPYWAAGSLSLQVGTGSTSIATLALRLNSIYDTLTVSTYVADPSAAADTADGSVQIAQMYSYWTNLYRYWTVVKSEYHLHVWNDSRSLDQEVSVWTYHNGQQQPPLLNEAGTDNIPDYVRGLHRHAHVTKLRTDLVETGKSWYNQGVHIHGNYRMGNYTVHNDVAEDEFKETWHKTGEVPSLREVATFIMQRSDLQRATTTGAAVNLKYELRTRYYVQFKDLKAKYQYPAQDTDFSSTTDPFAII